MDAPSPMPAMLRNNLRFVLLNSLFGIGYAAFNLLFFAIFMGLNASAWVVAIALGLGVWVAPACCASSPPHRGWIEHGGGRFALLLAAGVVLGSFATHAAGEPDGARSGHCWAGSPGASRAQQHRPAVRLLGQHRRDPRLVDRAVGWLAGPGPLPSWRDRASARRIAAQRARTRRLACPAQPAFRLQCTQQRARPDQRGHRAAHAN